MQQTIVMEPINPNILRTSLYTTWETIILNTGMVERIIPVRKGEIYFCPKLCNEKARPEQNMPEIKRARMLLNVTNESVLSVNAEKNRHIIEAERSSTIEISIGTYFFTRLPIIIVCMAKIAAASIVKTTPMLNSNEIPL